MPHADDGRQKRAHHDYLTMIPVDILEALGAIVVNFAALEESLSRAIWFLIAPRDEGVKMYHQSVTAELSFKQKVWMFANVFRERYGHSEQWLTDASRKCFAAEEQRNAFIHSIWQTWYPQKPDMATRLKTRARGKRLATTHHDHTREELSQFARTLLLLGRELESAAFAAFVQSRGSGTENE